jgi:hypothetical protein
MDTKYPIDSTLPMIPVKNQKTTIKVIHSDLDEPADLKADDGRRAASTTAHMGRTRVTNKTMNSPSTANTSPDITYLPRVAETLSHPVITTQITGSAVVVHRGRTAPWSRRPTSGGTRISLAGVRIIVTGHSFRVRGSRSSIRFRRTYASIRRCCEPSSG